jgi:hypothetical protein
MPSDSYARRLAKRVPRHDWLLSTLNMRAS